MATSVFLSSTAVDLAAYRDAVFHSLAKSPFYHCVRHENSGPQNADALIACERMVRESEIYLGLIGLRRGWEPPGDNLQRSITEMEHDWAREVGLTRYLWLAPDELKVEGNLRESDVLHERQLGFRHQLRSEIVVAETGFETPEALGAHVLTHLLTQDLSRLLVDRPGQGGRPIPRDDAQGPIAGALSRLSDDHDVDLGDLVEDPSRVDIEELSAKLLARAEHAEQQARAHLAQGQDGLRQSARYWRHIGGLSFLQATDTSIAAYERAVELDPNDPEGWQYLGELKFRAGDRRAAADAFETLKAIGERTGDRRTHAMGSLRLAWVYDARGEYQNAERLACAALDLALQCDWLLGVIRTRGYLGMLYRLWGRLDDAETMCEAALKLATKIGARFEQCIILGNLGAIHQERQDYLRAVEMYGQSIALNESLGRFQGVAIQKGRLGEVYLALRELERALGTHKEALAIYRGLSDQEGIADQKEKLGHVYLQEGQRADAVESLRKARTIFSELDMAVRVCKIDQLLSEIMET